MNVVVNERLAMQKPLILHFITPSKNASPFDANMAYDAGFEAVNPYTNVTLDEVNGLIQDIVFSRGPRGVWRTGIFIGGYSVNLAMDMLQVTKQSMIPPFVTSAFADPSGAFTTSATIVVMVEQALTRFYRAKLSGNKVKIFGGMDPIGLCTAVLAARHGAEVHLVDHSNLDNLKAKADYYGNRYGVFLTCIDGSSEDKKREALHDADVVLCCATTEVPIISADMLKAAASIKVVADINAVPPSGVEGIGVMDDGVPIVGTHAVGIGALAIGCNKYNVQQALFKSMINSETQVFHDFMTALDIARKVIL